MKVITVDDLLSAASASDSIFLKSQSALNLTDLELTVKLREPATDPALRLGFGPGTRNAIGVFAKNEQQEARASTQGHVAGHEATGVAQMEPHSFSGRETKVACASSDFVATEGNCVATDESTARGAHNRHGSAAEMLPTQASDDATNEEATASCAPGLRAEVEARLRWARAGWKWGMAQFWRNTGRKSRKGVSIPASLKISLGRERMAHDTIFFVDMLPLPKLAEVIERLPAVTLPWYRQMYRALVDLHGSNPGDTLFGILRAANDRGAKGAYVPNSLARLNKSEAVTQIIVDGTEVEFPMRSYDARKANAPDWKGFWNGFDGERAENEG